MESPIQDDPYEALGVTKIANAGDIKTAYRKLALRCHPDKVTDPLLKQQKADEFHKVQQAYEILNDDEKRNRYDARVRLAELKAEMMQRETTRGGSSSKGSVFERPARPSYPSFARSSTAQYEVRTPRFANDDYHEEPKSSTRRHSPHAAYTRRTEPQTAKSERERKADKEEKARSERRRAREADVRESRDRKYYSSTEDIHRAEEDRKRRDDVVRKNEEARKMEEARRAAAKNMYEAPSASRTSYDKYYSMEEDARRYQASAGQSYSTLRPERPEPVRTSSHQYAEARRSRARGTESRHRGPEIVDERVPSFSKSATTPEKLREMAGDRAMPPRSYSHNVEAREYAVPPAPMRRADSMPMPRSTSPPHISTSSSRRKEDSRSSKLRHGETVQPDSGYSSSSPVTPDETDAYPIPQQPNINIIPPPTVPPVSIPRTTTYHYPSGGFTGERLTVSPDKYTSSSPYKTETRAPGAEREREKDRERRRAHERTSSRERDRPPMASVRTVPAPSGNHHVREPVRAPSYSHRSPDAERERDRVRERERERDSRRSERTPKMGYAEIPSEYTKRHNMQPRSYEKEQVNVGKKYDVDDIKFSGRSRGHDDTYMRSGRERGRLSEERERYDRPSLSRSSTAIY